MTTTAAPAVDTVEIVPSFIRGSWWTPDDAAAAAAPVLDASTGELLAKVSTDGLDLPPSWTTAAPSARPSWAS